MILGDAMAAGRYINHAEIFDLNQAVGIRAAAAINAVDAGDDIEAGLALGFVAHQKADELAAATADITVEQADELVDAVLANRVAELAADGQAAYQRLLGELRTGDAATADLFGDHLVGAMVKNWDNPTLTGDEMRVLYRATSPDQSLTDTEVFARCQNGQRYDPASPNAWPQIAAACQSFGADTLVLMANGTHKAIADVEVGDMVLATNPEASDTGPKTVTAVWPHHDTLVDLIVGGGRVTTTEDHPFWNHTDQAWQQTQNIDIGDQLLTPDGTTITNHGLDWTTTHTATAYDLTIADHHTFYIHTGHTDVLVHNSGGCWTKLDHDLYGG